MEKQYTITGMTCGGCVAKVKSALEAFPGVRSATIQLEDPQGVLDVEQEPDLEKLQQRLQEAGNYHISEKAEHKMESEIPAVTLTTYKPLVLIISFITGVSVLAQFPFDAFSWMTWMRHFMAGFFIVFSFFKLINPEGFAASYRMYDVVAARWKSWGYVYPFVELILGTMYLIDVTPYLINSATVVILGISSIGVIKSNLDKKKIKCACLGDVFNLPMSTVTIVEDVAMVAMAGWMLIWL